MMTISPALQKYMEYQQMAQAQQQMGQPQSPPEMNNPGIQQGIPTRNPLGEGAMKGLESSKRSLEMNDAEQRRAMGRALMAFAGGMSSHVPQPGSGFAGALGAINSGFLPGLTAYDAERNKIEQQNFALMQQQNELEKQARLENLKEREFMNEIEKQEQAQRYHEGLLNLSRERMNELTKDEKRYEQAQERKNQLVSEGILPENAVMFDEIMDKDLRKAKIKDIIKRKDALVPAAQNLKAIQELLKLYRDNPNLWRSGGRIFETYLNKDDAGFKALLAGMAPKEIVAAQRMRNLAEKLVVNSIKAFPGIKSVTIEKMIGNTMAKASTHPDAAEPVLKDWYSNDLRLFNDAKRAHLGWKYQADIPEDISETEAYMQGQSTPEPAEEENPLSTVSTEDLEAMLMRLEGGQ
jgi:hypothetical protein